MDQHELDFEALQRGDASATRLVFTLFFDRLQRIAQELLVSNSDPVEDAEDIALEALDRLFEMIRKESISPTNQADDLWPILLRIVKPLCVDTVRRGNRRPQSQEDNSNIYALENMHALSEIAVTQADEWGQFVTDLDSQLRNIVNWRLQGLSVAEIANRMGVVTRTVERKLQQILKRWTHTKSQPDDIQELGRLRQRVTTLAERCSEKEMPSARLIDSLAVQVGSEVRQVQLYVGDLTNLPEREEVDVLVVSAYQDCYTPAPGSFIEALERAGVSLEEVATHKEVDLRSSFSCWMSRPLVDVPDRIRFRRILCFESGFRGEPGENLGDIFRSLAPFVGAQPPVQTVAMPLVNTGYQGELPAKILRMLTEAAIHWLSVGLPITEMKIVCHPDENTEELATVFSEVKAIHGLLSREVPQSPRFDVFVSYSHDNAGEVSYIERELRKAKEDIQLFIDHHELNSGTAWQQEIFESLDDCQKVLAVYSPAYLESKVCKEEFNIAYYRNREARSRVLAPIYLYNTRLPTYMELIQYWDCREFDRQKIRNACMELVREINCGNHDLA